ncbi:ABC transporter ATP-binding protein [Gordonia sp. N1V]|uniref:ABC transporter ATP-binding protein n=1 Tax=Gordonia sp. N1V TaxID=3034163 RepID=UPI0023E295F0|nr:ABC transporter ATP-binding protein [Gordonia sp. N1V]MDF3284233.1 ABC transporter ATP-binding protein [Gordonia sp. N1V]
MTTVEGSAEDQTLLDRGALRELLQPVRSRIRVAQLLQVIASAATVVPFVGIVELGRTLLLDGPVQAARVWWIVAIVILGLAARALFGGAALGVTHYADVDLQVILRRRITAKLGRLPLGWFGTTSSGRVRQSVQNDVGELHYLVAHADVETTAAVATPLFALIYCFVLDWRLGLLAVATLPLYAIAYAWMVRDMTTQQATMNAALARISSTIVEFVTGVAVVKTFGQTGRAHRAFLRAADEFNDDFAGYVGPMLRIEALAAMMLSAPLILLVNLAGGYWFVDAGWVGAIDVLGATLIAMVLPSTLMAAMMAMHSRQGAAAAAGRIVGLLTLPELPIATEPAVPEGNRIEIDDVHYSYPTEGPASGTPALQGVSVTLEPGTLTALVGPSGSGKSTLATLIPRFVDPDAGAVHIGGVDVRDIDPQVLYRHVGFVLQDVALLDMSVADNIALGRPDATRAEVESAARAARIHDRITALPNGYDTRVGTDAHLSGGEAQRVAIARALLCDTPILILDEATAFADPESEADIQQAISSLIAGRTVLVIAHRLGSITHADTIVVLDEGRIVERGRHDDLVAAGGTYATMWRAWRSDPAADPAGTAATVPTGVLR